MDNYGHNYCHPTDNQLIVIKLDQISYQLSN